MQETKDEISEVKLPSPLREGTDDGVPPQKANFIATRLNMIACFSVAAALGILSIACEEELDAYPPQILPTPITSESGIPPTPEIYSSLRFLSYPFPNDPAIKIQQGWYYNWLDEHGKPAEHKGIDVIKGRVDDSETWKPFDVLAAADGWAVANPPARQGNAVFVKHNVNGKVFYTYYGHLEKIEGNIPQYDGISEGKVVKAGDKIGVAGASGVTNEKGEPEPTWIHLHFGVQDANGPIDPFGEYETRDSYPDRNFTDGKALKPNALWK